MESSFDCYTPLERPTAVRPQQSASGPVQSSAVAHPAEREDGECESDESGPLSGQGDSSDDDYEVPKRAILLPRRKRAANLPLIEQPQANQARKKYDIWTEKIREDSLTETMRNFGVNRDGDNARSVEWYDHTMGGTRFAKDGTTNRLKRRRSSARAAAGGRPSSDDRDEDDSNEMDTDGGGKRVCYSKNRQNKRRVLEDLEAPEGATLDEVAKELADKLHETNESLILQVTATLGRDFVHSIYKETQRIEEDGGMMIRGNRRRRTSGGVFLFLIKHNSDIDEEKKREAFTVAAVVDSSEETSKRDEEIEELKKSLITQDKDSPKLLRPIVDSVKAQTADQDTASTLSNPPPSPVAPVAEDDHNNNSSSTVNDHNMDLN